ncbi:hypothetical protein COLO4_32945 [Corchorus olitorius]|uniref:Sulfotransferase n=1 Tax=Corchorus olitorius TaxID=93759 RepID=A0A1R3GX38_9ROSI|nr:hypothetical protein COLO4_32945 [Corchorus olitorius]
MGSSPDESMMNSGDFGTLEDENDREEFINKLLTLPSRNDWNFPEPLYQYQGFWNFSPYIIGLMLAQKRFQAQPNDIILCSHPKTGPTWLKALAFANVTRSQYDDSTSPLLTKSPHDVVPFIELDAAQGVDNRDLKVPLAATHGPFNSLPTSFRTLGCKIVYICRDPKDAFMSLWHFMTKQIWFPLLSITFEDAFEMFCEGVLVHGPYWEHVLEYWRASLESPEMVLFFKYEDLKTNTSFHVKRLADFMGFAFTPEEEKQGAVDKIIELCSLETLSSLEVNRNGKQRENSMFECRNGLFFRKGKVGDWKSAMTPEMGARLDRIVELKLSGSGLTLSAN